MAQNNLMMINEIEEQGISEPKVLHAMSQVDRFHFIPDDLKILAYANRALPIDCGQSISQPYIVAYMLELLNIRPYERVLEIGTGSGYNAAILANLAKVVYSIEINSTLALEAQEKLSLLGHDNIIVSCGNGLLGDKVKSPFDVIIITAAIDKVPNELLNQLADGGRLIAPLGNKNQHLFLWQKSGNQVTREILIPVRFVRITS